MVTISVLAYSFVWGMGTLTLSQIWVEWDVGRS